MRILAMMAEGFVLPHIHASMVRAFRSLGVEVLDLPIPRNEVQLRSFVEVCQKGYEAVFILDLGADPFFTLNVKHLQISTRIHWIIWFVDDPEGYGFPEVCEPDWTLAFCWDREIAQQNFSWNGKTMEHLPLATDPGVFFAEQIDSDFLYPDGVFVGFTAHPNEVLDAVARTTPGFLEDVEDVWEAYCRDFRQSLHDLSWIRLARKTGLALNLMQADPLCRLWVQACVYKVGIKKRQEVVSGVLGPAGCVFGDEGWVEALVEGLYRGWVPYGDELRKIYRGSGFVLDVRQPQGRTGLTQRIFDASACGSPVLTEWSPELETLFDPGDELLCFHNLEQAVEKKKCYLTDPKAARKVGEKARLRVLAHHTYRHRAARILQALQQFRE
jgi:spore maturation protein CgeB